MLLFADLSALTNPVETVHLPPLIVLHHIIVLSPLLLPHQVHSWSEAEYLLWLRKHEAQEERLDLLEKAVNDQVGEGTPGADEEGKYVALIREVLGASRQDEADEAAVA